MEIWNIEERVLVTHCQKCSAPDTKSPLSEFILTPGVLFVPDILHCTECGAQLTVAERGMTKVELEKREKEDAEDAAAAEKAFREQISKLDKECPVQDYIDNDETTPKI